MGALVRSVVVPLIVWHIAPLADTHFFRLNDRKLVGVFD